MTTITKNGVTAEVVRVEGSSSVAGLASFVPTPPHRFLLARAEKRLTSHIAHNGIDQYALELCAMYERMEAANVSGAVGVDPLDDLLKGAITTGTLVGPVEGAS